MVTRTGWPFPYYASDGPLVGPGRIPCRSNVKVFVDRDKEGRKDGREAGRRMRPFLGRWLAVLPEEHRGDGEAD